MVLTRQTIIHDGPGGAFESVAVVDDAAAGGFLSGAAAARRGSGQGVRLRGRHCEGSARFRCPGELGGARGREGMKDVAMGDDEETG